MILDWDLILLSLCGVAFPWNFPRRRKLSCWLLRSSVRVCACSNTSSLRSFPTTFLLILVPGKWGNKAEGGQETKQALFFPLLSLPAANERGGTFLSVFLLLLSWLQSSKMILARKKWGKRFIFGNIAVFERNGDGKIWDIKHSKG